MMRLGLPRRARDAMYCLFGALILVCVCAAVGGVTGTKFFAHGHADSYTVQAMAWRAGHVSLAEDMPWLELAVYQGRYYISFPPTPTIPMLLLSFAFGEETPNVLMTVLYFLFGYAAAFALFRRYMSAAQSLALSLFLSLGGSLLDIAVSGEGFGGGVWFQAQLLAYALTMLAFYLVDGDRLSGWAWGLVCVALAVGARPLNGVFAPVMLILLYPKLKKATFLRTLAAYLPFVAAPLAIAGAYGAYNYARFGNPLEFGHSYLPEYTRAGTTVFGIQNLPRNIANILRPPGIAAGTMIFPIVGGFAVYLTNPLPFIAVGATAIRAARRRADWADAVVAGALVLEAALLLTHLTNGGWQYGTRYLCDLLPASVFLLARGRTRLGPVAALLCGALVALNVYGTVVFHFI